MIGKLLSLFQRQVDLVEPLLKDDLVSTSSLSRLGGGGSDDVADDDPHVVRRLLVVSYLAGILTMACMCLVRVWFTKNIPDNLNFRDDENSDNMSIIDPWNVPSHLISRIGETISFRRRPTRRHWPWETIRQRLVVVKNDEEGNEAGRNDAPLVAKEESNVDDDQIDADKVAGRESRIHTNASRPSEDGVPDDNSTIASSIGAVEDEAKPPRRETATDTCKAEKEKSSHPSSHTTTTLPPQGHSKQVCIGSIFGLDVGGTLAKLAYLEQKPQELDPIQGGARERHYAQAASAQVVLKARMAASYASGVDNNDATTAMGSEEDLLDKTVSSKDSQSSTRSAGSPHYLQRRRSLSVGFMSRQKELQKERPAEKHQGISEKDLQELHAMRQDSLPDDVRHFRHSVDFHSMDQDKLKCIFGEDDAKSDDDFLGGDDAGSTPQRSKSMIDLASHSQMEQKAEALSRFYNFARRLDAEESLRDHKLSFYSRELGGEFHFVRFETRHMQNAMDLIRYNNLHLAICDVGATGGGAHKFADAWEEQLGIRIDKQQELDSQVAGMQFVLSTVIGECYTFRPVRQDVTPKRTSSSSSTAANGKDESHSSSQKGLDINQSVDKSERSEGTKFDSNEKTDEKAKAGSDINKVDDWWWSRKVQRDSISYSSAYPYLVVTIGTGVSILRVDGPRKHERISGSTIGGGTYWGLMRLLTDVETFDDAMKRAEMGDPCKVDMMVGDIYGNNSSALEKLGLPAHVVASSFGKLVAKEEPAEGLTQEDLARALLLMVTNNIGLIAYLNAKTVKTSRIYFVGSFLSQNMISQRRLSYAIDFWSKGEMEALFLEHEGYFGALGAFLLSQNIEEREEGFFQWDSNPNNLQESYRACKTNALLGKHETFDS